ncbi:MAG: hypothetical protein ACI9G1_001261 [Pirellulaceae bacterium]|jgi:hypothetical protein
MSEEATKTQEAPAEQPPTPQQQMPLLEIKDEGVKRSYANFCRVSGTPEELVLDFGFNPQIPEQAVEVADRVVVNYYTAKRLLGILGAWVQRHEQVFGPLEIDVNRRVQSPPSQP